MIYMWYMTLKDYANILKRAKAKGIKPGESIEKVLIEYMEEKGQKPQATDLNKEELLKNLASEGKKILSIEHDEEDGEQTIRIIKKEKKDGSDSN